MLLFLAIAVALRLAVAGPNEDDARLGQFYTDITVYRSGSGTNVVSVGLGDPVQDFNLTLSTNVEFILIASEACDNCLEDASQYASAGSRTYTGSQRAFEVTTIFPTTAGAIDAVQLKGTLVTERITDSRQDSYDRVVGLVDDFDDVTVPGQQTRSAKLPAGVSGFFGLGIYRNTRQWSIMPSLQQVNGRGAPAGVISYVVGFDMAKYHRDTGVTAGSMHFGAVPSGSYTGNFNWINANTSVAGSWGVDVDRLRIAGKVVDGGQYYASLDPGFDAIYVPERVALDLFSAVSDATRDTTDPTRWNVPCDAQISMTVTIGGREYNVDANELVQQRGVSPNSCWSSIVSWQTGSLADAAGEIRLGTPFLSGVYAAIYYAEKQQFVGLAGKPGSVNDFNALTEKRGKPNGKLAGILIGSLLAVLILALVGCYARNRNSFQSIWYRGVRRQHRAQVNMMVRAATIPPPMVGASMVIPPPLMGPMRPMGGPAYIPVPMGPGSMPGGYGPGFGMGPPMMGPMNQSGGWQPGPPMYQAPMQQSAQQHPQMHMQPGVGAEPPSSVEYTPRGQYASRHQSLPLPTTGHHGRPPKSLRHSMSPKQNRHHRDRRGSAQDYGARHGDFDVGPDTTHGLLAEHELGENRYPSRSTRRPNQKLHFGGIGIRQEEPRQQGGGPLPPSEPSMVQRDRMAAKQERIDAEDAAKRHLAPPLLSNHPLNLAREARLAQRGQEDKRKRKSWRSWTSRDKGDRLYIPSFQSEMGIDPEAEYEARRIREFDPPPKPSSTWIKSTYENRLGHASWRRAERERNRRTLHLDKGIDAEDGTRRKWYA